ncbi:MAG: thioesterase family protein [Bacteroidota bacterium]
MYVSETSLRVRYGETDQMGYAYYGNYAEYFEVGRVEALRQLGMSYRSLEEKGIMLPVYTFSIKYLKPALYDDLLLIRTTVPELPGARIRFLYEAFNEKKELLCTGEVVLVFIDKATKKPIPAPGYFVEKIRGYF